MAFDGLITKSVVYELNTCLIGGKIDRIFCPNSNEVLLGVYSSGIKYALNINISSNNYRINLTTNASPNPLVASNFCMVLRKYLLNTRISKIYSIDLERIVIIEFEDLDLKDNLTNKKLIIELMGKHSNVILTDENYIIINSIRHLSTANNSNRDILPKYKYIFPTSNKLNLLSINDFNTFFDLFDNVEKDLPTYFSSLFTGISKTFIQHCSSLLKISDEINKDNLLCLYNYVYGIIDNLNSNNIVCASLDNDYSLERGVKSSNLEVNFFLDDFYTKKERNEAFSNFKNDLLKLLLNNIKKLQIKLENIDNKLKDCKEMDKYKLYGELITSNLYRIKKYNVESIDLENYYDENKVITIPLDNSISPNENAKKFFKKYNKLKSTFGVANKQKNEIEKEMLYIESVIYAINESSAIEELNDIYQEISGIFVKPSKVKSSSDKQKTFQPFKYNIDNFTILVGKNNLQNDYITHKLANSNDYWFHVKDSHGSHVILKTEGKIPSQEIINKCASIAAYYSKSKYSSNVPVDYTLVKNVKKMPKSKPGMVIYTNYKTVNVNPQKISTT